MKREFFYGALGVLIGSAVTLLMTIGAFFPYTPFADGETGVAQAQLDSLVPAELDSMQSAQSQAQESAPPSRTQPMMPNRMGEMMGSMTGGIMMDMSPRGMMSILQQLSGATFEEMYLRMMVMHHEMAVRMSKMAMDRAEHPEVKDMAQDITDTQEREMEEMRSMVDRWYGTNANSYR